VSVVFLIAVLAVLVGVFFAATGRGGELAIEHADHAPLDLGSVSAADVALLHPPTALWGYNMQVTDEALDHIARAMRDRDVTIARLRQQLANLDSAALAARQVGVPATQADSRARTVSGDASAAATVAGDGDNDDDATQTLSFLRPPGTLVASRAQEATQPREIPQPAEAITQPREPAQPSEVTQPSATLPPPHGARGGPQGSYDTYDWWAEQEAAARKEAQRQADAQHASAAQQASAPEASAAEASAAEASAPEASQHVEGPAEQADAPSGRTSTQPNPTLAPPDDETLSAAEEQAW
jgi:hypothetical protein